MKVIIGDGEGRGRDKWWEEEDMMGTEIELQLSSARAIHRDILNSW